MEFTTFLRELDAALADLPPEETARIREFYSELYFDAVENGKSEEEAVAALGDIGEIRDKTLAELAQSEDAAGGSDSRQPHALSPAFQPEQGTGVPAGVSRPSQKIACRQNPVLVPVPLYPPCRRPPGRRGCRALSRGLGRPRLALGRHRLMRIRGCLGPRVLLLYSDILHPRRSVPTRHRGARGRPGDPLRRGEPRPLPPVCQGERRDVPRDPFPGRAAAFRPPVSGRA